MKEVWNRSVESL